MTGENYFPPTLLGAAGGHVSGYLLRPLRSLDEVVAERSARERMRREMGDLDGAEGGLQDPPRD